MKPFLSPVHGEDDLRFRAPSPGAPLVLLGSLHDPLLGAIAARFGQDDPARTIMHYRLEDLAAARWAHRVGEDGATGGPMAAPGRPLVPAGAILVNRLKFIPDLLFVTMRPVDRDYARNEFLALLTSWLAALGEQVVNPPTGASLAGPALRPWQWLAAAIAVDLPPLPAIAGNSLRRLGPRHRGSAWTERCELQPLRDERLPPAGTNRPFAFGRQERLWAQVDVVGDATVTSGDAQPDSGALAACRKLARQTGADILSIILSGSGGTGGWRFLSADPHPARLAAPSLDALGAWLARRL